MKKTKILQNSTFQKYIASILTVGLLMLFFFHFNYGSNQSTATPNQPSPLLPDKDITQNNLPNKNQGSTNLISEPTATPSLAEAQSNRPQYKYQALIAAPSGVLYQNQPFLSRIGANDAWTRFENTNSDAIIAVIDTGFSLNHTVLSSRWTATKWDFVNNDNTPQTVTANHGTIVAGLAGLLNPNAKIMPLQALNEAGEGYTDQVADAVRFAVDNGADVINLSLGSDASDPYLLTQINYAISNNVVVVAAAGNDGCNCMLYPAAYSSVVAVGASDSSDNRASFSSYGTNLDLLAPGTINDVCTTSYTVANPTNLISCSHSGTSIAAPIVSSLASMMIEHNPTLTPAAIEQKLANSATKIAAMGSSFFDSSVGFGRINASSALNLASINGPYGVLVNKSSLSLSASTIVGSPAMSSSCVGVPASSCVIYLTGPSNQQIEFNPIILNEFGVGVVHWNAASLNLAVGSWQIRATQSANGQTVTSQPVTFTIQP